jgi:hypothetical protein
MNLLGFGRFRHMIKIAFNPPLEKRLVKQEAKNFINFFKSYFFKSKLYNE